jgi:hypothetical protein
LRFRRCPNVVGVDKRPMHVQRVSLERADDLFGEGVEVFAEF